MVPLLISGALLALMLLASLPAGALDLRGMTEEDNASCLYCHSSSGTLTRRPPPGARRQLSIPESEFSRSAHKKLACLECHTGMDAVPHRRPGGAVDCIRCHAIEDASRTRLKSHEVHPLRGKDRTRSAPCTSCHGVHAILPASNPSSTLGRAAVTDTCGACHAKIRSAYLESVHGRAHARGIKDSAVCTDCHSGHAAAAGGRGGGPARAQIAPAACSRCHANEKLSRLYGLDSRKSQSYLVSYHGIAQKYGDLTAADCASCHGYHTILPSSDPESSIHKKNLTETCGRCHPGAGENFARGNIHVDASTPSREPLVFYIRLLYILFIAGLLTGLLALIVLDLAARRRAARKEAAKAPPGPQRTFERLTLGERVQHLVLAVSFMLLVATGAPLFLYDNSLFHRLISSEALFRARGDLHRWAAAALIVLAVYHLLYVLFSRRGRRELVLMIPRVRDFFDFAALVRYNLGLAPHAPKFGRYTIVHKFEYLAVAWGSLVMIATGLMLWFAVQASVIFPKWLLDVARVVHGYEATLAFLVIIVWHFYNVHLNPDVFPMSSVWIDGKLTEEEMRRDHPLEYEELMKSGGGREGI